MVFNCNQAENTPSTANVDINIMQQNLTLKLVTQFEMNAKHSKKTIKSGVQNVDH